MHTELFTIRCHGSVVPFLSGLEETEIVSMVKAEGEKRSATVILLTKSIP